MVSLDKIPDLLGFLILTEDGAVLESGGDLKNDERCANVVTSLINLTDSVDPKTFAKSDCQRISVVFEQHSYTICLSNKKVYVIKRLSSHLQQNGQPTTTASTTTVEFQSPNQADESETSLQPSATNWTESV